MRRRHEAESGSANHQGALASLLRMLASSTADRAWCRHGLVVLYKARLSQEGMGTVLDRLVTMVEEELFETSWGSKRGDCAVLCFQKERLVGRSYKRFVRVLRRGNVLDITI